MEARQALSNPKTEGIKYAGSKLKLLPEIIKLARKTNAKTIFDGFAGTTRVSQSFAQLGYRVISNDISVWSKTFGLCYLKNRKSPKYFEGIIGHLNNLPGKMGWYTKNYGGSSKTQKAIGTDNLKKPFQIHNTKKLDAIRDEIEKLDLNRVDTSVLLTSLILALDKVDSTIGHHTSYLKEWSPRSFKTLELKVPQLLETKEKHQVLQGDIFQALENIEVDLAYYDPPYGSNNEKMPPSRVRYASYYHLWTSIILNDKPEVFGKAKRRFDSSDRIAASIFEEFRKDDNDNFIAVEAIKKLLNQTKAKHIILSYSSGGRATMDNLFEILENSAKIMDFVKIDYKKNVMASMRWTNKWIPPINKRNEEYLFLIKK